MATTATEYVAQVNDQLRGLYSEPRLQGRYDEYEAACRERVLDPDVIGAFSSTDSYIDDDFMDAARSMFARTEDSDRLFIVNGYTAVARPTGVTAVYSALLHASELAQQPDPVEAAHPGYSNMALIKAGRAVMDMAKSGRSWPFRGQAYRDDPLNSAFAGSTGMLLMHGDGEHHDVRGEILEDTRVAATLDGVDDISQLAGFADQIRSELTLLGQNQPPQDIGYLVWRAASYISQGVNVH